MVRWYQMSIGYSLSLKDYFFYGWCQFDIVQCWLTNKSMWVGKLLFLDILQRFAAKLWLYIFCSVTLCKHCAPKIYTIQFSADIDYILPHGLVEDCSIPCALAMEILQSCTHPSICTNSAFFPAQHSENLTDNICKCIFFYERGRILFQISLKFVPHFQIDKSALVQLMAKRDQPYCEPMPMYLRR